MPGRDVPRDLAVHVGMNDEHRHVVPRIVHHPVEAREGGASLEADVECRGAGRTGTRRGGWRRRRQTTPPANARRTILHRQRRLPRRSEMLQQAVQRQAARVGKHPVGLDQAAADAHGEHPGRPDGRIPTSASSTPAQFSYGTPSPSAARRKNLGVGFSLDHIPGRHHEVQPRPIPSRCTISGRLWLGGKRGLDPHFLSPGGAGRSPGGVRRG